MTIKTFSVNPGADNSLGLVRNIRAEFGGTPGLAPDGRIKPAQLSQYYRGGTFVPSIAQNATIPTTGQIQFGNFFGTKTSSTPPLAQFTNGSFEDGTTNGWTIVSQNLVLNGGSTILGYPTPAGRASVFPVEVRTGKEAYITSEGSPYGGGTKSLYLGTGLQIIAAGYGTVYGPAAYSTNPVVVASTSVLTFQWRGVNVDPDLGGDAYSVFGYMLNPINGNTIKILEDTSPSASNITTWQPVTKTFTAGQVGVYHFVFVAGSYDATGGTFVGGALLVDNISITTT
jgi:hypothetical protein